MNTLLRWTLLLGAAALLPTVFADSTGAPATGAAAATPAITTLDQGWPRTFTKDGDTLVMYQPQVDAWTNYTQIHFRSALAVTPKGAKEPLYGVMAVQADTLVDKEARSVLMTNLTPNIRFPGLPSQQAADLQALVTRLLPSYSFLAVSLDRVTAYIKNETAPRQAAVSLAPPPIYFSSSPAILVGFMGAPVFKPVAGNALMFALHTNWPVFLDTKTARYYLLNQTHWLAAPDPVNGPWTAAGALPADFASLPADPAWDTVRKNVPGQPESSPPKVFVSTTPAELIQTDGAPLFTPVAGTSILYVNNPVQPLFLDMTDNAYYYQVAGRWFTCALGLGGPWTAVTNLPADFFRLPPDGPLADVLATVPGTPQARDAVLLASVPRRVTVSKADAKIDVTYDGTPAFAPVQGTAMQFATNTRCQVLLVDGVYYCCYQAAWFQAPTPTGPWSLCASVPAAIYTIPASNPLYNVTYVTVAAADPDGVDYTYSDGYYGGYVAPNGVLVYGAGVLAGVALADAYTWYPCTPAYYSYGCSAWYSYAYGGYYHGGYAYGPYGGAGWCSHYNPATGAWTHGGYAYGPHGAVWGHDYYNPYTDTFAGHIGGTNGYQSWGRTVVYHDGKWTVTGHDSGPAGRAAWARNSAGQRAARGANGDLYAGHDGNVYRRASPGQWQVHQNGDWQNYRAAPRCSPATVTRGSDAAATVAPARQSDDWFSRDQTGFNTPQPRQAAASDDWFARDQAALNRDSSSRDRGSDNAESSFQTRISNDGWSGRSNWGGGGRSWGGGGRSWGGGGRSWGGGGGGGWHGGGGGRR